jgi:hypothetical protein
MPVIAPPPALAMIADDPAAPQITPAWLTFDPLAITPPSMAPGIPIVPMRPPVMRVPEPAASWTWLGGGSLAIVALVWRRRRLP